MPGCAFKGAEINSIIKKLKKNLYNWRLLQATKLKVKGYFFFTANEWYQLIYSQKTKKNPLPKQRIFSF
jgi:hypothetical protein